ncbi:hypothetical protein TcasGA2_TC010202 [Tribolium castaneum]|uniref:Uncharacterized protein n=1 Tax=Tribolium castaneum TaxID=7070 RepID=D6WTL1_TRICA|nr:PREDICTED: uncharacterized protein LOC663962 [Tribolium castaneum]XP_008196447.1 PREDICTED: uncharacterized protein LOC663962 [Tribolium castaneum]XP_976468.1 PREDICTED: uncharacterized protein LOC663962 [Tribolium castaneum]EFA07196.1 hypothetical protein TcasGA2_TC010202 [Tribolium castaneum]|eukprot:XP_008196446.1 PREDICTED: uncharacterized protein LOC663962 [Tribolium castaneum]
MENIYKIKIRSNPNPRDLYPSERRYSSSIVLGLSIMFLALGITSSLMGTLVVKKMTTNHTQVFFPDNHTASNKTEEFLEEQRLIKRIEEDFFPFKKPEGHTINIPAIISAGSFVMSLGHFLAGFAGILAWKQWYIDNNITWFFLSSCFSTLTSAISFLLISLAVLDTRDILLHKTSPISLGLTANIFITSLLGVIWSIVATNVAFKGMKNNYPDDLVLSKSGKGRVEVNTVRKGNKIAKVVPPDILDHFPKTGKLAKFFPKSESNGNLPKAESNKEYEERVKRFLSGESQNCKD